MPRNFSAAAAVRPAMPAPMMATSIIGCAVVLRGITQGLAGNSSQDKILLQAGFERGKCHCHLVD